MSGSLPIADYDYAYPEDLIAAAPAEPRDSSRLMVLDRASARVEHSVFRELPRWLRPTDCLVLNRTKVIPCRLIGRKSTGGKVDVLLVHEVTGSQWTALSSGLKRGQQIEFAPDLKATVAGTNSDGEYVLDFSTPDVRGRIGEVGFPPLPPYIAKRRAASHDDAERYQTVYAQNDGSIAAPTAGLHFTPELIERIQKVGVTVAWVTLHVGRGTFRPIAGQDAEAHTMLPERYEIDSADADKMNAARLHGGRIIAVGTTVVRTLETAWDSSGRVSAARGESSIYIRPGSRFRAIDALITNFHLPRSTPLLLASAFAGREKLLAAYAEAISLRYRLFSFGDATLII